MSRVAEAIPRTPSQSIRLVARAGYATKGILYFAMGILAVQAAWGGERVEGGEGTMAVVSQQPFGRVLLVVTICGLFGYAFWRALQSIMDTESEGDGVKGWVKRAGYGISSLGHIGLAIAGIQMLVGQASGSNQRTFIAQLMSHSVGQVLLVIAGICVIGAGIAQLVQAKTADFARDID